MQPVVRDKKWKRTNATDKNETKYFRTMNQLFEYVIYGWTNYNAESKAAGEGKQHSSDSRQQSKPTSESTHVV